MNNHSDSSNHSHHNNESNNNIKLNNNNNEIKNNKINNLVKISDFSIDHILNRAGENFCGTNNSNISNAINFYERVCALEYNKNSTTNNINYQNQQIDFNSDTTDTCTNLMLRTAPIFDWLQYTRYRPPKLPRPFRPGPIKRTPGRLPRVPFTPAQLNTLENAYKQSTYLSSEDANKLALQLDLTNTRVKIWFQNRRARERREKRERGESPDILTPISSPELNLNAESP